MYCYNAFLLNVFQVSWLFFSELRIFYLHFYEKHCSELYEIYSRFLQEFFNLSRIANKINYYHQRCCHPIVKHVTLYFFYCAQFNMLCCNTLKASFYSCIYHITKVFKTTHSFEK